MPAAAPLPPVVLAIGGHDPTGGAGIQADIEAVLAQGAHAVTLVTSLTTQNTAIFSDCPAVSAAAFRRQGRALLDDIPVQACKIGLVPDRAIAEAVADLLQRLPGVPVVLDPVLAAGTGHPTADEDTVLALRALLPRVTVLTPNGPEARRLAGGSGSLDAAAAVLLDAGCAHVLITGTHENTARVVNTLYSRDRRSDWDWERLPHSYHGSGCTLAAALAAQIALGHPVPTAAALAQDYTWRTLQSGLRLGQGQFHPDRLVGFSRPAGRT